MQHSSTRRCQAARGRACCVLLLGVLLAPATGAMAASIRSAPVRSVVSVAVASETPRRMESAKPASRPPRPNWMDWFGSTAPGSGPALLRLSRLAVLVRVGGDTGP